MILLQKESFMTMQYTTNGCKEATTEIINDILNQVFKSDQERDEHQASLHRIMTQTMQEVLVQGNFTKTELGIYLFVIRDQSSVNIMLDWDGCGIITPEQLTNLNPLNKQGINYSDHSGERIILRYPVKSYDEALLKE